MAKSKKVSTKKVAMSKEKRKKIIVIMSIALSVCILASAVFGFKLYAFGKDVTIVYSEFDGTSISKTTQVVEVCKRYKLAVPSDSSHQGRVFLYWSTDKEGKNKVRQSGLWLESTKDVVLYAVWGKSGDEWTGNY